MIYELGDIAKMRKKHPCGNDLFTVIRIGADIKIKCRACGRIIMLERSTFERRLKTIVTDEEKPTNE